MSAPICARGGEKLIELQVVVAQCAGNGRAPGEVFVDEWPHDLALEAVLRVHEVVGDAEVLGDATRIVDIVNRAAAALDCFGHALAAGQPALVPELKRETDDRMPWACSIAATVDESTPPDMAIAMVSFCGIVPNSLSYRFAARIPFCCANICFPASAESTQTVEALAHSAV